MKDYKPIIDKLDTQQLCLYLKNMKWQQLPDLFDGRIKQFQSEKEEEVVLVPLSKNFTDYYREIKETLDVIANIERKTIEELINKLLNPSQDILKWRIADEITSRGAIPFNSMTENIEHIKDLLASTILDITAPAKIHPRLNTKEVISQLSNYQFGQTEIGSYILNILCPQALRTATGKFLTVNVKHSLPSIFVDNGPNSTVSGITHLRNSSGSRTLTSFSSNLFV